MPSPYHTPKSERDARVSAIEISEALTDLDGQQVPLRKVKAGDFFRRKASSTKTYTRQSFIRDGKVFECDDHEDISRSIYLKGSTMVFVGFTY